MPRHAIVLTTRRYPRPKPPEVPVHDEAVRLRTLRSRRAALAKLRTVIVEVGQHVQVAGHRPLEAPRPRVAWEDWHPDRHTRL